MAIALNLSSRLSGHNNRAICITVKAEYKFAICLLLGVWLGYQLRRSYLEWGDGISEIQVNNKQLPNSVVQNGSAGFSYSNERTGSDGTFAELRNHEIGKDFLKDYQDSKNKIDELKALLDKTEKEHQRRKKNLEALLHGKNYEKGAQPGNFQTGPDPSELNDGDHSFSKENGAPDKYLVTSPQLSRYVDDLVTLGMLMEEVKNECSKLLKSINQLWGFVEGTEEFRTTVFAAISQKPLLKTLDSLLKSPALVS